MWIFSKFSYILGNFHRQPFITSRSELFHRSIMLLYLETFQEITTFYSKRNLLHKKIFHIAEWLVKYFKFWWKAIWYNLLISIISTHLNFSYVCRTEAMLLVFQNFKSHKFVQSFDINQNRVFLLWCAIINGNLWFNSDIRSDVKSSQ